jgi:predicted nucleic acid binding AN1-type Zn finger protein
MFHPPHASRPAGSGLHGTCRGDALVDVCCAERSCRKGLAVAVSCKHCAKTFCSEHAGPDHHGCAAARQADKRALVCERCGVVVIEHNAAQVASDDDRARLNDLTRALQEAQEEMLAVVRDKLSAGCELRANLHSFWSAADGQDEAEVAPTELRDKCERLKQQRALHLLAMHMATCGDSCPKEKLTAVRAPASHKQVKCGMRRCKNRASAFLQHCRKCDQSFCISHRLPEVHACCA